MRFNNCSYCYQGLIVIKQILPARIHINQLICSHNFILQNGCLLITTEEIPFIYKSWIIIQDSLFIHNIGQIGVGLYISNNPFKIVNTLFIKNQGSNQGGAIFVTEKINYFSLNKTIIIENSAYSGGGVYLQNPNYLIRNNFIQSIILFKNLDQLNLKMYKIIEQGKTLKTNYLLLPRNQNLLKQKRFNEKKLTYESYFTQFSLIYKNSFGENLKGEENDNCQLFSREVSEIFPGGKENYKFVQNFTYKVENYSFDLSAIDVQFDPYQNEDRFIQLLFSCQYSRIMKTLNYQIDAKTFKCQLGEFYSNNGCQQCESDYGFYSVEYDVRKCSIFDINKFENITSNQLELKEGYWRPHLFSNLIQFCFKSSKQCVGGWQVGDELCFQGHIGGFCEECDSFNIRGNGNFVKRSNTECGNCSNIYTLFPFFLILVWSFISIMFNLRSIRKTNKTFVILKTTTKLHSILFKLTQDFKSIYFKMLLNYLWTFSVIMSFNTDPIFSLRTIDSVSSPNFQMATNLDCKLIYLTNNPLIYSRLIVTIILLIIQCILIITGFKVHFYIEKRNFDYSVISNILIYLYVSNQTQLIKSFGSFVAIRTISENDYVQGDVSLLFHQQFHMIWLYTIILPSLIITGKIIPLLLLVILVFNKNKYSQTNFRKHFGFLFNEYKEEISYWELFKILQRSIVIIIITYFETNIYIKAALMSLTLLSYIFFAVTHRPYIIKSLNNLDFESCCIILISIFIAIVENISQQSDNQFQTNILQIIMLMMFFRILYCFVSKIISFYYQNYIILILFHINNLSSIFFKNSTFCNYLKKQQSIHELRKQKLNHRYQKLREWRKMQFTSHRLINILQSRKQQTFSDFLTQKIPLDQRKGTKSFAKTLIMK